MQVRFVNHAAFICEQANVRLMCDPWLYGSAFNDGWDLICKTRFAPREFEDVQYLWFSHEHPDHFSPRVLLDIPEPTRRAITVLYKPTTDGKVLGFCKKIGFRTRELESGKTTELGGGLRVRCRPVPLNDSWLLIESDDCRVLNLNDAVVHSAQGLRQLRKEVGELDVLFTQFNYAAWRGNREDTEMRRADAKKKLEIMTRQVQHLAPKFTVPFASFSYFSHEENFHTNDAANTPSAALRAIAAAGSVPVLLYPDDRWQVGQEHDNTSAEERYRIDYVGLQQVERRRSPAVSFEVLSEQANVYIGRIQGANDRHMLSLLRRVPVFPLLGPVEVHLWDLGIDVKFSFEHGLEHLGKRTADYQLEMASDSLHFLLKHAWGIDTLTVNGRFRADAAGMKRLIGTFAVDALNNAGIALNRSFLRNTATISFLVKVMLAKLWSLRLQKRSPLPKALSGLSRERDDLRPAERITN
jgi:UDP-MurNAc hydroxylase